MTLAGRGGRLVVRVRSDDKTVSLDTLTAITDDLVDQISRRGAKDESRR